MTSGREELSTELQRVSINSSLDVCQIDKKKLLLAGQDADNSFLKSEIYYLRLLLRVGLIPTSDSSKYFLWLNKFVCLNMFIVGFGSLIYIPVSSYITREHPIGIVIAGRLGFSLYTTSMYIYMSGLARCKPGILSVIYEVGQKEENGMYANPCTKQYPIKRIVFVVIILFLSNLVISIFNPNLVQAMFGLSRHPAYMCYLQIIVYFISFSWMVSIPFVYLGCKLLTEKIKYFLDYIKSEFETKEDEPVDLFYVMAWHDELYEKNRVLTDSFSGIVSITIMFLAFATTAIAIHIAIIGVNENDVFWFFSNFFILCATCYPVGELEMLNRLLNIAYGAAPMPMNMTDLNLYLNLYQTCTIKSSRSQFGIFVKGTKIRITFFALIRVGSLTLSAIIFIAGVMRISP